MSGLCFSSNLGHFLYAKYEMRIINGTAQIVSLRCVRYPKPIANMDTIMPIIGEVFGVPENEIPFSTKNGFAYEAYIAIKTPIGILNI